MVPDGLYLLVFICSQRQKEAKVKERAQREHGKVVQAVDNFLKVSRQQHNFLFTC